VCKNVENFQMFPHKLAFTYAAIRTSLFLVITRRVVVISRRRFGTTYRSRRQSFKNANEFSCSMTAGKQLISYTIFRNHGPWKQHNQFLTGASNYSPRLHYLHLQLLAIRESKKEPTYRTCRRICTMGAVPQEDTYSSQC